ncbi:hypothetical protein J4E93_001351 [Alternaria ventricosa]|uniref:uncharacterized protein n=1 Tax=Alternaria ventricosa TaxID=1187951 RepID=UPI0020C347E3|nr:uncharacterized protein J4E93_001351 [Alternaria ventricosa]KAI4653585.1 hypothetical protein J4E93_001351 [Alternaria ventricosa]
MGFAATHITNMKDTKPTMPSMKQESPDMYRTDTELGNKPVGMPITKHNQTGDTDTNRQPTPNTCPPVPDIWLFRLCNPPTRKLTRKERAKIFRAQERIDAALCGLGPGVNIAKSVPLRSLNLPPQQDAAITVAQEQLEMNVRWRRINFGKGQLTVDAELEASAAMRRFRVQAHRQGQREKRRQTHKSAQIHAPSKALQDTSRLMPASSPLPQHPTGFISVSRAPEREASRMNAGQPKGPKDFEKAKHRVEEEGRWCEEFKQWYSGYDSDYYDCIDYTMN